MSVYKGISGIYKITSPSGKIYIGQSYNIHNRYIRYKKLSCKSQTKLFHSLKKYGFENHKFEILQQAPRELLNALEIEYIKVYRAVEPETGLNLNYGGFNGAHSEETKRKQSERAKGRVISEDTRRKMSEIRLGKPLDYKHRNNLALANQARCSKKVSTIIDRRNIIFNSMSEAAKFTGVSHQVISYRIKTIPENLCEWKLVK